MSRYTTAWVKYRSWAIIDSFTSKRVGFYTQYEAEGRALALNESYLKAWVKEKFPTLMAMFGLAKKPRSKALIPYTKNMTIYLNHEVLDRVREFRQWLDLYRPAVLAEFEIEHEAKA